MVAGSSALALDVLVPGGGDIAAGLDVVFVGLDGAGVQRARLADCWNVPFERVGPVRGFSSFRGQRNFPGLWWSATSGTHVGFESWLERDHLMLLDFDPAVVAFSCQPFWMEWSSKRRTRRHAPDLFARRADGSGEVLDVRPDDRIKQADAEAFAVTAAGCEAVGWGYRRVGDLDPVLAANVRWLSGYRHPRCLRPALAQALGEVFAVPRGLRDGAAAVGEPVVVLPVLFHLLWCGQLIADLASRPLGASSMVQAVDRTGTAWAAAEANPDDAVVTSR